MDCCDYEITRLPLALVPPVPRPLLAPLLPQARCLHFLLHPPALHICNPCSLASPIISDLDPDRPRPHTDPTTTSLCDHVLAGLFPEFHKPSSGLLSEHNNPHTYSQKYIYLLELDVFRYEFLSLRLIHFRLHIRRNAM